MTREDRSRKNAARRDNGQNNAGFGFNITDGIGDTGGVAGNGNGNGNGANNIVPGTTGRYLVLLKENTVAEGVSLLREFTGLRVTSTQDSADGVLDEEQLQNTDVIVFDQLAVAVVDALPEHINAISGVMGNESSPILAIEPERIVFAFEDNAPGFSTGVGLQVREAEATVPADYLYGYKDAVDHLIEKLLGNGQLSEEYGSEETASYVESEYTWGLQATKVVSTRYTGRGIKVAVLDTGFDLRHPDFVGRTVVTKSFIAGEPVEDGHGHGTHCIGTACGPKRPTQLPRYGIAYQAEIYAGKVLNNRGSGTDSGILAGINWAVANKCQVVSMSLGAPVMPGQSHSQIFEQVANRALAAGTLIIAAAGNSSRRPGSINPVGHPANCPSIMAVGALNSALRIAFFSEGGLQPNGGQVDIAGPGVDVRSSWPRPMLYRTISGTSMATPHVAGIAALFAESNARARGRVLAQLVMQHARRLALPARDVGTGLVQAP